MNHQVVRKNKKNTQPEVTEQHYHISGNLFLANAVFASDQLLRKISHSLAAKCYTVFIIYSDCVCLLFGAEQVGYSGFLLLFHWQQLPDAADNVAAKVNLNCKVVSLLNNELRLTIKLPISWVELQIQVTQVTPFTKSHYWLPFAIWSIIRKLLIIVDFTS